jgi:hypothetical protein
LRLSSIINNEWNFRVSSNHARDQDHDRPSRRKAGRQGERRDRSRKRKPGRARGARLAAQRRAGSFVCAPPWQVCRSAPSATEDDFRPNVRKRSDSLRPQHTILALATLLEVKLDLRFPKDDEAGLVKAAIAAKGPVLIAWEHEDIPTIVNGIVDNNTTCPQKWPDTRFDLVWILDRRKSGSGWKFRQVPQLLLPGDSKKPIK